MKKLVLYKNGQRMLGSDGVMQTDDRFNLSSIINAVHARNRRYAKNLPNLVCDGFKFCDNRWDEKGNLILL